MYWVRCFCRLSVIQIALSCKWSQAGSMFVSSFFWRNRSFWQWFQLGRFQAGSQTCWNWTITWWWFQIFLSFTPTWGRFPFWLTFFKWVETTNQIRTITWHVFLHPLKVNSDDLFPPLVRKQIPESTKVGTICLCYFVLLPSNLDDTKQWGLDGDWWLPSRWRHITLKKHGETNVAGDTKIACVGRCKFWMVGRYSYWKFLGTFSKQPCGCSPEGMSLEGWYFAERISWMK